MNLTPQGAETCLQVRPIQVWDHRTDGFRERCCCSDGSLPGGRLFASRPRHVLGTIQPWLNLVKRRYLISEKSDI